MIVKNRQQMAKLLNERMTRTYTSLSERQKLESDTSLIKTYLVEAHSIGDIHSGDPSKLIKKIFSIKNFGVNINLKIHFTDEATLVNIEAKIGDENVVIYVDFTNPRYWRIHSTGSSNSVDWLIERLLRANPEIDRVWFPASFLEYISKLGSFRGLSLDYDRRKVPDVDFQSTKAPVEFLKMQLWGNKASDILRILREEQAFPHETTLSKIKVKFWLDGENEDDFSIDDIKFNGKITARGTSFQSHISLISKIYDLYAKQVQKLETEYALQFSNDNNKLTIQGSPIIFSFDNEIGDMEVFLKSIFSCGSPFYLWGMPVQISSNYYRVQAFDMHIGSLLRFEVTPNFFRLYLLDGTCGNSVLRLYTNLQHYYDSLVRVEDTSGNPVIEF